MSFFDDIRKNFNPDAVDMYNDEEDDNYRQRAFENTSSNHGWYKCPKCGKSFRASGMDADHIYTKKYGVDNSRENLQLLCAHCNRSKGSDRSDSAADAMRRRQELREQDKRDREFIKRIKK